MPFCVGVCVWVQKGTIVCIAGAGAHLCIYVCLSKLGFCVERMSKCICFCSSVYFNITVVLFFIAMFLPYKAEASVCEVTGVECIQDVISGLGFVETLFLQHNKTRWSET